MEKEEASEEGVGSRGKGCSGGEKRWGGGKKSWKVKGSRLVISGEEG